MDALDSTRRQFLKGSAAAMAVGATASLTGLYSRQVLAAGDPVRNMPIRSPYGTLAPVADRSTGLKLLQLPAGFSYQSFAWSGDRMADGQPCPDRHDGMAVVGTTFGRQHRGSGGIGDGRGGSAIGTGSNMVLIRNHERGAATPFDAPGMYDTGDIGNGALQQRTQARLRVRGPSERGTHHGPSAGRHGPFQP